MINYWIIPIVALVSGCIIGAGAIEYKVNTVWPNGEIEREEMKNTSCPEIMKKASLNDFWTPQNGKIGRGMSDVCVDLLKNNTANPYVEFCSTEPLDPPFWPDKLIQNSTHKFNHEFCVWDKR